MNAAWRAVVAAGRFVLRRRWWLAAAAFLVALLLESAFLASALTGTGCAACHAPAQADERLTEAHGSLDCLACHRDPGPAGWVRVNVRAAENFGSWLLRRDGVVTVAAPPPEARCRSCHEQAIAVVTGSGGVRMRHSDVVETPCGRCHTSHPAASAGAGLVDPHRSCRACHDGTRARSDCAACHVATPPAVVPSAGAGQDVHPAGWSTGHGMGSLVSCADCHEPQSCAECHGVPLPHDRGTFLYTHGDQAQAAGEAACLACHAKATCEACHTVPVPHPEGFLAEHADMATSLGSGVCGTCHLRSGCDRCHLEHIHPGLPEDMRDRLRASTGIDR